MPKKYFQIHEISKFPAMDIFEEEPDSLDDMFGPESDPQLRNDIWQVIFLVSKDHSRFFGAQEIRVMFDKYYGDEEWENSTYKPVYFGQQNILPNAHVMLVRTEKGARKLAGELSYIFAKEGFEWSSFGGSMKQNTYQPTAPVPVVRSASPRKQKGPQP